MTRPARIGARLLGVVGLLLCGSGLVACGGPARAAAGDVVAARSPAEGHAVSVEVPTGRVDVVIGSPVGDLSDGRTKALHGRGAPDGGSFVPVSWTFDAGDAPWGSQLGAQPKPAELTLDVGGASYDLGSAYHLSGSAIGEQPDADLYVAVAGHPDADSLSVGVSYDGLTQTVTGAGTLQSGGAAALYDLPKTAPAGQDCPSSGWRSDDPRLAVRVDCQIGFAGATPYYPGVGWASTGMEWVVLTAQMSLARATVGSGGTATTYRVTGAVDRTTFAGTKPQAPMTPLETAVGRGVGGTIVFARPAAGTGTLRFSVALDLEVDDAGTPPGPDTLTVDVSRVIPLRGLT